MQSLCSLRCSEFSSLIFSSLILQYALIKVSYFQLYLHSRHYSTVVRRKNYGIGTVKESLITVMKTGSSPINTAALFIRPSFHGSPLVTMLTGFHCKSSAALIMRSFESVVFLDIIAWKTHG